VFWNKTLFNLNQTTALASWLWMVYYIFDENKVSNKRKKNCFINYNIWSRHICPHILYCMP
jgi:hypothetical protein